MRQAVTRANVDQDLYRHMWSPGNSESVLEPTDETYRHQTETKRNPRQTVWILLKINGAFQLINLRRKRRLFSQYGLKYRNAKLGWCNISHRKVASTAPIW